MFSPVFEGSNFSYLYDVKREQYMLLDIQNNKRIILNEYETPEFIYELEQIKKEQDGYKDKLEILINYFMNCYTHFYVSERLAFC